MTESDIYQLVGEAYCNGMAHGMEKAAEFDPSTALGRDGIHPAAQKKALEGMRRMSMDGGEAKGPMIPFLPTPWNFAKRPDDAQTGMKGALWALTHPISNSYNVLSDLSSSIRKNLYGE